MISIQIKGLSKTTQYLRGLSRYLRQELGRESRQFMLDVRNLLN